MPRSIRPRNIPCPVDGCNLFFTNRSGLRNHVRVHRPLRRPAVHPTAILDSPPIYRDSSEPPEVPLIQPPSPPPPDGLHPGETCRFHPLINGRPCDLQGNYLPEGTPPPPWDHLPPGDWSPYESRTSFELADLLYRRDQMPGSCITDLMQIWAASLDHDQDPPFADKGDLYDTIDATSVGDVQWQSFSVSYTGDLGDGEVVPWKMASYDVWYRDPREVLKSQLSNPDFANEMDFAPKEIWDAKTGRRRFQDFMSGCFSWRKAVSPFCFTMVSKC